MSVVLWVTLSAYHPQLPLWAGLPVPRPTALPPLTSLVTLPLLYSSPHNPLSSTNLSSNQGPNLSLTTSLFPTPRPPTFFPSRVQSHQPSPSPSGLWGPESGAARGLSHNANHVWVVWYVAYQAAHDSWRLLTRKGLSEKHFWTQVMTPGNIQPPCLLLTDGWIKNDLYLISCLWDTGLVWIRFRVDRPCWLYLQFGKLLSDEERN